MHGQKLAVIVSNVNWNLCSDAYAMQLSAMRESDWLGSDAEAPTPRHNPRRILELDGLLRTRGRDLRIATYQLCHVLAACGAALEARGEEQDPLSLVLLIDGPVRRSRLRAWFADSLSGFAEAGDAALSVPCRGSDTPFSISWGRLELIVALAEFLYMIDPEHDADDACREALAAAGNAPLIAASISAASNRLASAAVSALNTMLDDAPVRERFGRILTFLESAATDGRVSIDDETVMAFWEHESAAAADGGAAPASRDSLKLFESVYERFVSLLLAIEGGAEKRGGAAPFDIDAPGEAVEMAAAPLAFETEDRSLARLDAPMADTLRLLSQRRRAHLRIVDDGWRLRPELPVSAMRATAIGAHQNKIVQALRDRRAAGPLLAPAVDALYAEQLEEWRAALEELETLRLACARVIAHHAGLSLGAHEAQAQAAWSKVKRRASFADALESIDARDACGDAVSPLASLSELLERLLAALPADLEGLGRRDAPRFAAGLRVLYD